MKYVEKESKTPIHNRFSTLREFKMNTRLSHSASILSLLFLTCESVLSWKTSEGIQKWYTVFHCLNKGIYDHFKCLIVINTFSWVWQNEVFLTGSVLFCSGETNQMRYPWIAKMSLNAYLHPTQKLFNFPVSVSDCTNRQTPTFILM